MKIPNGVRVMSSAKEFREYADECMVWAKQAQTDDEREIYLNMAQDWIRAAATLAMPIAPFAPSDSDAPEPEHRLPANKY
jgi:hypothetical protein